MKKLLLIAFLLVSTAGIAHAATPAAAPAAAPSFDTHKADMLKHIGERIADLQKKQDCVNAATDEKSLEACGAHKGHKKAAAEAPAAK